MRLDKVPTCTSMGTMSREHRPSKPGVAGSSPAGRASSLRERAAHGGHREAPRLAPLAASGSESCRARQILRDFVNSFGISASLYPSETVNFGWHPAWHPHIVNVVAA